MQGSRYALLARGVWFEEQRSKESRLQSRLCDLDHVGVRQVTVPKLKRPFLYRRLIGDPSEQKTPIFALRILLKKLLIVVEGQIQLSGKLAVMAVFSRIDVVDAVPVATVYH